MTSINVANDHNPPTYTLKGFALKHFMPKIDFEDTVKP